MSYLIYDGPSMLNGEPIIAVMTGIGRPSENRKTGPMAQVWIMPRDESPTEAYKSGSDAAVCGDCPIHSMCYVLKFHGMPAIFKDYHNGEVKKPTKERLEQLLKGKKIRIGAWGDPAALPESCYKELIEFSKGHTGYTHQWRRFKNLAKYFHASVESLQDAKEAQSLGFKTFRIVNDSRAEKVEGEQMCPASAEAGRNSQCMYCMKCKGETGKNIVEQPHGRSVKKLKLFLEGKIEQHTAI
jgi:hypothetical protein